MKLALYRAEGFSMEPFLLDGDDLIIDTSENQRFAIGDILLYRSPSEDRPVAHRLAKIDSKSGTLIMRPDAHPKSSELLAPAAVLGRVEHVRRGARVMRARGSLTGLYNRGVAALLPCAMSLKDLAAPWLTPFLARAQRATPYRRLAARLFRAEIKVVPYGEDRVRALATVGRRYAGSADLEVRETSGARIGWITSVFVRVRYRGAGIAARLLEALESHARSSGLDELLLEVEAGSAGARELYESSGFLLEGRLAKKPLPSEDPPASALEAYAARYASVSAANARTLEKLRKVLGVFNGRGIDFILLKGADFATRLYGPRGLRGVGDIDLLAHERDLPRIDAAVRALGLKPAVDGNASYVDDENSFWLDIATDVWYLPDDAPVWRRAVEREALGARVRSLEATDCLLFICAWLCLHRAYFSAGFAEDVFQLVRREAVDWERLCSDACRLGLKVPVYRALSYAQSKRPVDVPVWAMKRLAPEGLREKTALYLLNRLVTEEPLAGLSHLLFLMSRPRGTALETFCLKFFPRREFLRYRYGERPRAAFFLIRCTRPFCLAYEGLLTAARIAMRLARPAGPAR